MTSKEDEIGLEVDQRLYAGCIYGMKFENCMQEYCVKISTGFLI